MPTGNHKERKRISSECECKIQFILWDGQNSSQTPIYAPARKSILLASPRIACQDTHPTSSSPLYPFALPCYISTELVGDLAYFNVLTGRPPLSSRLALLVPALQRQRSTFGGGGNPRHPAPRRSLFHTTPPVPYQSSALAASSSPLCGLPLPVDALYV